MQMKMEVAIDVIEREAGGAEFIELRPDFRALANPLKIDGVRPQQVAAHDLGADTERVLSEGKPAPAARSRA